MAYADPLDPATPDDTEDAEQGDDRIREMKRAIIQRLLTVFQDLDADPLTFVNGVVVTAALADLAVATGKIADLAVATGKLADLAVTNAKVADTTLTKDKVVGGAGMDKLLGRNAGLYTVPGGGITVNGNSYYDVNVSVSGASGTKNSVANLYGVFDAGIHWNCFVNGTGIVTVRLFNRTASPIVIPAGTTILVTVLEPVG